MILFWLVPLALVIWLLSRGRSCHKPTRRGTALEILDERYARGEIGQEEYNSRRADLLKSHSNDGAHS